MLLLDKESLIKHRRLDVVCFHRVFIREGSRAHFSSSSSSAIFFSMLIISSLRAF